MKYIKIGSIFLIVAIVIIASVNYFTRQGEASVSKVALNSNALSQDELKELFPDANFRNVVARSFPNQEITLEKIENLSGEFYASNENIEDLTGIGNLKNIERFVFWNNDIKKLPREILKLNNLKSINISSNYITENDVLDELKSKNVKIDSNLNFIKAYENQYSLNSYYKKITLKKGAEIPVYKLLYRNIDDYEKYWEVTKDISKSIKYYLKPSSELVAIRDGCILKAKNTGKKKIKLSLDENYYKASTVEICIEVVE